MKKEAEIQVKINHYIKSLIGTPKELTGGFETKVSHTSSFSLNSLEPQQLTHLTSLLTTALYWKLSDVDPRKKPFDFFVLPAGYSYLVIHFTKSKITYVVLFVDILALKKTKKKQTFSEEEISQIATRIVKL